MWEPQWSPLTERFRTVRCDLRGFGESPLPHEHFNPADDVRRLLDDLEIERARFVGSSFGGRVALEIATRWPRRVERLGLLCAEWEAVETDPRLQAFTEDEDRLLGEGDIEGAVELNVRTWVSPEMSPDHRALFTQMQRLAFEIQLEAGDAAVLELEDVDPAAVEAPTLVVSGGRDFVHFRRVAAALAERIPNAEHLELDWAGHLPSLERPDLAGGLLLDHLSS